MDLLADAFDPVRDRGIAHSESPDLEIDRALAVLNGQILTAVAATAGRSSFAFDLSCVLETRPYDGAGDDDEQWMFFQPSGDVLSLRADGRLHTSTSSEP